MKSIVKNVLLVFTLDELKDYAKRVAVDVLLDEIHCANKRGSLIKIFDGNPVDNLKELVGSGLTDINSMSVRALVEWNLPQIEDELKLLNVHLADDSTEVLIQVKSNNYLVFNFQCKKDGIIQL